MNKVILSNTRLVRDVEVKVSNGLAISKFTVACNRAFNKEKSDFINCVAFGKRAETIAQYFSKGSLINLEGRIQTGFYEKDGQKKYTFEVVVENFEFPQGNKNENKTNNQVEKKLEDILGDDLIVADDDETPF
ncbi:MAG: single-stranded DNA-binding protein [Lactobacillus johnsonii]|nr:single-stranded DNA-binding protein [Lactobacillus johnsonii]